jgi:phosphatidylglycerol:prolipoprotein diacylglycerol transferase
VRSTLFFIPAEVAGVPVFGVGWLLLVWGIVGLAMLAAFVRRQGWNRETASYVAYVLIVAAVIVIFLPNLVETGPDGRAGVPIRGFGVMFMLAAVAGVALAAYRAWQMGVDPEVVYSLAFVMFFAGLAGARLFYIVPNWDEFQKPTLRETAAALLNFTEGGLVVYGSVIFGLPAGIWFLRRRGLPLLPMADIIAPSMALGQAIGRIGCFLNGCCYGGVCLTAPWAMTFPSQPPPGSPPYQQHLQGGWHSGVWLEENGGRVQIAYVAPASPVERQGVRPGQVVERINGSSFESLAEARDRLAKGGGSYEIELADGTIHRWGTSRGPERSVPVHPAQIYAAIDAGLLALLLWAYFPFRRRDGEVFALLVTLHPISRFLLEIIRSDEPGRFGTDLTTSQWLSLAILGLACVLWWYIERQPKSPVVSGR